MYDPEKYDEGGAALYTEYNRRAKILIEQGIIHERILLDSGGFDELPPEVQELLKWYENACALFMEKRSKEVTQ